MDRLRSFVLIIALSFSAYSMWVIQHHGYFGFIHLVLDDPWGRQMLLDIMIAMAGLGVMIGFDARRRGGAAWPWLVATLFLGSIAPL